MRFLALLLLLPALVLAQPVDPFAEVRYCGKPVRNASGEIVRSRTVLAYFQRLYPCPSTGKTTGACPGWAINHTIPLSCGGCDSVSNLDWMPAAIKSCAEPWCRDRWERQVYDDKTGNTPACTNRVQNWSR
ncbi:MAG: HNH endonuclease [Candidatus Nanopelagicales bacterium]|jgi:hypothetical protein|nr:HNH endonuclease [Candidatus Nanopelagicales bacterium]